MVIRNRVINERAVRESHVVKLLKLGRVVR